MIDTLIANLRAAIERRCREFRSDVALSAAMVSLGAISLGFATVAIFVQLRTVTGIVETAAILAVAYAGAAVLIAAFRVLRRRASRLRVNAIAPSRATRGVDEALQVQPDQVAAVAGETLVSQVLQMGSKLSTTQLLVVALVGGLVAGRNIRK